ncbi:MAG: serine--tRNA ligase [Planctomycetota bacterium]|nr:serine--tRNA ligase [Planctomycetota bacterium]
MIDLKQLRENPVKFQTGAAAKNVRVDIPRLLELDAQYRQTVSERERLRSEQNKLSKEAGPQIGKLQGQLKGLSGDARVALERQIDELKTKPAQFKAAIQELEQAEAKLQANIRELLLQVPLPPDADVPVGSSSADNVEIKRWSPPGYDLAKSFEQNRGFKPKTHLELVRDLGLCDFERGVKMAGARSYVLTADGMLLHQAVTRFAMDHMVFKNGYTPVSVPVIVREEVMIGTGFFPAGREQAYLVDETRRDNPDHNPDHDASAAPAESSRDLFLTGTGEVGLMGIHQNEILDEARLPLKYVTVSTCFRREAGAAGKDTAGLYRIHQFEKVEQVVICRADEQESRRWHKQMIAYVEELLQALQLPYRLLQCCTGDLGVKNADMIDIESFMPGRGDLGADARPVGAFGETHSASRLYDFQCRRLNMRYRPGGEKGQGETTFCHSLNNTVIASPRVLIPILEMYQQPDGSVQIPEALRPYMGGRTKIRPS